MINHIEKVILDKIYEVFNQTGKYPTKLYLGVKVLFDTDHINVC